MKQFYFAIRGNRIDYIDFGVKVTIIEFSNFYDPSIREKVDYRIANGEVSDIICQADCMTSAINAVEKFLCYQRIYKVA